MEGSNSGKVWPVIAFITIVVLLGINFVAVKFSNQELSPFWGASLRFFLASFVLFWVTKVKGIAWPTERTLLAATLYGLLLFGATYGLLYFILLSVSAGLTSVMFTTIPLITLVMAAALGLEKMTWRGVIGALIVIGGIVVIFFEQLKFDVPIISLVLLFLAVLTATLSGIVIKIYPRGNPLAINQVGMFVGAVALFGVSLFAGETRQLPILPNTWLALGYLVTSSIVAFVLFVWLIGRWSVTAASYTGVLPPIVTVAVASMLIGEEVAPSFLIGAALVMFGVYVGVLSAKPAVRE